MPPADQFWDRIADEWRTRVRRSDEQIAPFIAALGCAPGSLVLDAGCGAGTMSVPLAARGYRVRGVDRSPRMIANARAVACESGLGDADAQFAVADVQRLPFPILPWEMERLLPALGWRIIAQDGMFGRTFAGATSEYTQEMSDQLNDRVLQQTVVGSWRFVIEKTD